jgi:hypothetical protein
MLLADSGRPGNIGRCSVAATESAMKKKSNTGKTEPKSPKTAAQGRAKTVKAVPAGTKKSTTPAAAQLDPDTPRRKATNPRVARTEPVPPVRAKSPGSKVPKSKPAEKAKVPKPIKAAPPTPAPAKRIKVPVPKNVGRTKPEIGKTLNRPILAENPVNAPKEAPSALSPLLEADLVTVPKTVHKELPPSDPPKPFPLRIPPILLEGEETLPPPASASGNPPEQPAEPAVPTSEGPPQAGEPQKPEEVEPESVPPAAGPEPVEAPTSAPLPPVVLASEPSPEPIPLPLQETPVLPLFYGARQLTLAARDPHWLHAFWDLSSAEENCLRAQAADGSLWLRIYLDRDPQKPLASIRLPAESRSWFVEVPKGGAEYQAALCYQRPGGEWETFVASESILTPADSPITSDQVQFASLPLDLPFVELLAAVAESVQETPALIQVLSDLTFSRGCAAMPCGVEISYPQWTPEEEFALEQAIWSEVIRPDPISSMEILEKVRQPLEQRRGVSSVEHAAPGAPGEVGPRARPGPGAISSEEVPGLVRPKGFWFNVNAELIVYGATEADAAVWVGDRRVPLRPDGTFSLRFSLPDGNYDLPFVAVAADGSDSRGARLKFRRQTDYRGKVEWHPQDPALRSPRPEHLEAGGRSSRRSPVAG